MKAIIGGETRIATRTFATLDDATSWRVQAKEEVLRSGVLSPGPVRATVPTFGIAAGEFLRRASAGKVLTRARRPYSPSTIGSYESALRLHVLPHIDERLRTNLESLPADALDGRAIQAMVNAITVDASPALARVADAAVSAVLRDLYELGLLDALVPRPVLPPPPPSRGERLTLAQADALVEAAVEGDRARRTSLMAPLVFLLVNTGLRISQALSLVWGAAGVDLEAAPPRVTVAQSATKTDAGARTIGLADAPAALDALGARERSRDAESSAA